MFDAERIMARSRSSGSDATNAPDLKQFACGCKYLVRIRIKRRTMATVFGSGSGFESGLGCTASFFERIRFLILLYIFDVVLSLGIIDVVLSLGNVLFYFCFIL